MKNIVKFLKDRWGVSPVIGVILMVAITVVLGAVVAAFAYGYVGDNTKKANVALSASDIAGNSNSLSIKHSGGESIAVLSGGVYGWKASVTPGKDSATDFADQAQTGDFAISVGTTLTVTDTTAAGTLAIAPGWYHVVALHVQSDAILLDTNVLVR